jgi:hypothetical protein
MFSSSSSGLHDLAVTLCTFASQLAISGESVYTIAELLGHKNIPMVKRVNQLGVDCAQNGPMLTHSDRFQKEVSFPIVKTKEKGR